MIFRINRVALQVSGLSLVIYVLSTLGRIWLGFSRPTILYPLAAFSTTNRNLFVLLSLIAFWSPVLLLVAYGLLHAVHKVTQNDQWLSITKDWRKAERLFVLSLICTGGFWTVLEAFNRPVFTNRVDESSQVWFDQHIYTAITFSPGLRHYLPETTDLGVDVLLYECDSLGLLCNLAHQYRVRGDPYDEFFLQRQKVKVEIVAFDTIALQINGEVVYNLSRDETSVE